MTVTAIFVLAAQVGMKAFWLLMVWLASAIAASELSKRKGYGEKWGLGTGLLLSLLGAIIWLLIPAREHSGWKTRKARKEAAAALAADHQSEVERQ
jgi:hypothetical protein